MVEDINKKIIASFNNDIKRTEELIKHVKEKGNDSSEALTMIKNLEKSINYYVFLKEQFENEDKRNKT